MEDDGLQKGHGFSPGFDLSVAARLSVQNVLTVTLMRITGEGMEKIAGLQR